MILQGNPVSPGVAVGSLFVYRPVEIDVQGSSPGPGGAEGELAKLESTKAAAATELRAISDSLMEGDPDKAGIFAAHEDILNDEALLQEVEAAIRTNNWAGDRALKATFDGFAVMLEQVPDPLIRERAADLRDVCARLLRIWHGVEGSSLSSLPGPVIVAARDLLPSDTATLDRDKVLAVLTEIGGATSHSAIIARSYGIPAVLGIPNLLEAAGPHKKAAVDALEGTVVLDPDSAQQDTYRAKQKAYMATVEQTRAFLYTEPLTADGERIDIGLNIGSGSDDELAAEQCADFVGLFRTEFLYMREPALPDEETQYQSYKKVLSRFAQRPVTLRTLDVGGDKTLSCMPLPEEDNPFLGNRALRLCFSHPQIFRTQLRAALRASVHCNLWLMLPMVSSMDDIYRAREILAQVHRELELEEGVALGGYKVGIMIETPSIAMVSDLAAAEVDFASIGTNDLCQYLMAVDRLNPQVSSYYQPYHPALFRTIGMATSAFRRAGKPISICGELGGDPLAAAVLVGLGVRKLSMNQSAVAGVKRMLSTLTLQKAEELAEAVVNMPTAEKIESYLKQALTHTAK